MLSVDEALARILAAAPSMPVQRVALENALNRVLADDLHARAPLPAFDYSAMDGFALAAADCVGAGPWSLPVVGESRTGHPTPRLEPQSACRIFTGAPIPRGADAVLMQENALGSDGAPAARPGELERIQFEHPVRSGEHVRKAGEDLAAGSVGLARGTLLGPLSLGMAAALDHPEVPVSCSPRVMILSTGDELRRPGSTARPGAIPESNSFALAGLARATGASVSCAPLVADDLEATRHAISTALEHFDVLITVGGVSVGDHDLVKPALEAAGVELDFWKVRIKPGKPLAFGQRGSRRVLGLPGNPMSAQITFCLFGLPLLRAMQGQLRPEPLTFRLPLLAAVSQRPGRRAYVAARQERDGVMPLGNKSSGNSVALAGADLLLIVPEDSAGLEAGALVDVVRVG